MLGDAAGFRLLEVDLAVAPLDELVAGADGVFHLAAQPGVRGSWGAAFAVYARDNVIATQRLFEAALAAGKRVVWASSSSVYGNAEAHPTREELRETAASEGLMATEEETDPAFVDDRDPADVPEPEMG